MIRRARESIIRIYFSGSIFAFFGVIDIAERPEVYFRRGQVGNFISMLGWKGRSKSGPSIYRFSKFTPCWILFIPTLGFRISCAGLAFRIIEIRRSRPLPVSQPCHKSCVNPPNSDKWCVKENKTISPGNRILPICPGG